MEAVRRAMDRLRLIGLFSAALAAFALSAGPAAHAQYRIEYNYCDRLQAQYEGALQRAGDSGVSGRTMVQMDKIAGNWSRRSRPPADTAAPAAFSSSAPARARNARRSWRRSTG